MRAAYISPEFAVFDDVLAPEAQRAFWQMFLNSRLKTIHADGVRAYFRPSDGNPYTSGNIAWTTTPIEALLPPGVSAAQLPVQFYPTKSPLDPVFEALREAVRPCAEAVGREGSDWIGVLARLYAYPAGTGISWHSDDSDVTGAFIFYANPRWDVQWGGELMVAEPSVRYQLLHGHEHDFDNQHESQVLLRTGVGRYVMPKPNRLVFLGAGNPHMVAKVAASAGDHVRASLAGFFMTRTGIAKLIEPWLGAQSRGER